MRKMTTLMKMLLLLVAMQTSNTFAQSIPEILYYKFDRTDSLVINYASGATSATDTAFILGSVRQDSIGLCGHALMGSGIASSTDYVNTGWAPDRANKSWTISFWTSNITGTTTLYYIFGDVNTTSLRCFTNGVAGANNWMLRGAGLVDLQATGGATAAPSMTTFTYDSATASSKAYVNGVLVNTVTQTAPNLTGTGPFKVDGYSTNVGMPVNGLMDEFRFYDRALSEAEILELLYVHTTATFTVNACDSMVSPSGLYTWTASGLYNDTIPNVLGCDSVITYDLTIGNNSSSSMTISACNGYLSPSGSIFTSSGLYQDIIPNANGCDSIIDIDLTILNVDTTVSFNGITLTSNSSTGTYQWVDCANGYTAVSGEINQSFTPTINGSYAVVVNGACIDTSACYTINNVGLNDFENNVVSVFPNPNTGQFAINTNVQADLIIVNDILGKEIFRILPVSNITNISLLEVGAGVYYVQVNTNNITQRVRVVVTQ